MFLRTKSIASLRITSRRHGIVVLCRRSRFRLHPSVDGAMSGNLSVQIAKLSKVGYAEVIKTFNRKMPCTIC